MAETAKSPPIPQMSVTLESAQPSAFSDRAACSQSHRDRHRQEGPRRRQCGETVLWAGRMMRQGGSATDGGMYYGAPNVFLSTNPIFSIAPPCRSSAMWSPPAAKSDRGQARTRDKVVIALAESAQCGAGSSLLSMPVPISVMLPRWPCWPCCLLPRALLPLLLALLPPSGFCSPASLPSPRPLCIPFPRRSPLHAVVGKFAWNSVG